MLFVTRLLYNNFSILSTKVGKNVEDKLAKTLETKEKLPLCH